MDRAGNGAPTHSHPVEEVLTVIDGVAEMWLDDLRAIVSAGQSLIVPAGRSHGCRNSGAVTLHIHAGAGVAGVRADAGGGDGDGAAVDHVAFILRVLQSSASPTQRAPAWVRHLFKVECL
jgi:uncharacterized protein YjlB